jgi:hypothetical protein
VHCLLECLEDRRRWSEIRVSRSQVDDVEPALKELSLALRNLGERILGQRLESLGVLWH